MMTYLLILFVTNQYIEENSSRFDNDYMRMRISQFTIPNIKNDIVYLEDSFWKILIIKMSLETNIQKIN